MISRREGEQQWVQRNERLEVTRETVQGSFTDTAGVTRDNCLVCEAEFRAGDGRLIVYQEWNTAVGAPVCAKCCAQGVLALLRENGQRATVPAAEQLTDEEVANYRKTVESFSAVPAEPIDKSR